MHWSSIFTSCFKFYVPGNGVEELTCPASFMSWPVSVFASSMLKPLSWEVLALVFPTSNTYFRELGLSGKGQVLWDSGKTLRKTGDCWQNNCWRLYEACVFPVSARPFTMLVRSGQTYLHLDFWICLNVYYLCVVVVSGICSAKLCAGCQQQYLCVWRLPGVFREWNISKACRFEAFLQQSNKRSWAVSELEGFEL